MSIQPAKPLHVGLTGGIGSGKSTVARMLADHGACIIDADQAARDLTGPGGRAMSAVAQAFGPDFIDAHGAMDRQRMRQLAFTQPEARQRLEAIIHPLVAQVTEELAEAARVAGKALVVFDIPLLVESRHWPRQLDAVVVVDCPTETQIARVMARSALERETIEGIIASQASRRARRAAADAIVYNEGLSLETLRNQVNTLAVRFGL